MPYVNQYHWPCIDQNSFTAASIKVTLQILFNFATATFFKTLISKNKVLVFLCTLQTFYFIFFSLFFLRRRWRWRKRTKNWWILIRLKHLWSENGALRSLWNVTKKTRALCAPHKSFFRFEHFAFLTSLVALKSEK